MSQTAKILDTKKKHLARNGCDLSKFKKKLAKKLR